MPKPKTATPTNAFDKLLPFTWRDKHYPLLHIRVTLAHDLVEHKYWGVDGARVEDTGLAPVRIEAAIPIANTIYPAPSEKWIAGALYPDALRQFVGDFAKRQVGPLVHPEFGALDVRPERLDFELSGEKRGATELHASFVETIEAHASTFTPALAPGAALSQAATNLDAMMTALEALAPQLPVFTEDLDTLGRKIAAIGDSITVASYRSAGLVNRVLYQANRIESSLLRAKNALTHPAITQCRIIQSAAYALRAALLKPAGIGLYTVRAQTTLPALVKVIPNAKIGDIIKLNPRLLRSPIVVQGTQVRYLVAA